MTTRAIQINILLSGIFDPNTVSPLTSGTVEFYAAGTSDAKNVWTEREKTNPYTSVTLDSDGIKHLYGDGVYKFVIKRADGSTIYTWDNLVLQSNTFTLSTKTSTYEATPDDDWILVDTDGAAVIITAETAANFQHPLVIKNIGSSSNDVTFNPYGAETVDGSATLAIGDSVARELASNGTNWFANKAIHASDHLTGGADEVDGDKLDIDWNPTNYTPATTPAEATSVDHLTAHLYGIDVLLGAHASQHITGGGDEVDGDKLDIDWNPSNYTPATTPAQADNVDNLTAHLYGVDQKLAEIDAHVARHISGGGDELDGDKLDIDWNPTNYTPATTPSQATSVDHLTAHLYGIDQVLSDAHAEAHASSHITGGGDEVDGDKLDIDWNPTNYTPSTTPSEATSADNLTAHLYGIDQELGSVDAHASDHVSGGSDQVDGDHLDIDWNPSNYTPATTPGEASSVDHLTAHLYGIDQELGSVDAHASDHITGGSDQVDGDKLDIDWNPSNYTPATTPAQADSADNLTAHLYGIDQVLADAHAEAHAGDHLSAGSDEVDGDKLDIDWNPTNYTPATTPGEVTSIDHLTAHLYGIDQALVVTQTHASTHIRGGSDEVDGDQLDIDWDPSNYTPSTTPAQASSLDHLTAHLYGIDQELGSVDAHASAHITGGGDQVDGDKLDIDWDPTNYTPATTPAEASSVDNLTAHLYGIDVLLGTHATRHVSGGGDEIDGDVLDIDWNPSNYTPATTPAQVTTVDQLTAHLYGIDVLLGTHAGRHITGAGDEIDGDKLDIDWDPTNYTPATTPAEADSVDNLTAHLYGVDQELANMGAHFKSQVFTSGGTWTRPSDVTGIWATLVAAGGGGGGGDSDAAFAGGGGQGGWVVQRHMYVSGNVTVTIGSGGAGGAADTDGNDGSNSTLSDGCSLTAYGGKGGKKGNGAIGKGGGENDPESGCILLGVAPALGTYVYGSLGGSGGSVGGIGGRSYGSNAVNSAGTCPGYAPPGATASTAGGAGGGSFGAGADGNADANGDSAAANSGGGGAGGGNGNTSGGTGGSGYCIISWTE